MYIDPFYKINASLKIENMCHFQPKLLLIQTIIYVLISFLLISPIKANQKTKVAILHTINQAKIEKKSVEYLNQMLNKLFEKYLQKSHIILSKDKIQEILEQLPAIQVETCIEQCEVESGLLVKADYVVASKITKTDSIYHLKISLFDTKAKTKIITQKLESDDLEAMEAFIFTDLKELIYKIDPSIKNQEPHVSNEKNHKNGVNRESNAQISSQENFSKETKNTTHQAHFLKKIAIGSGVGIGTSYSGIGAQMGIHYIGNFNGRLILSYGSLQSITETLGVGLSFQTYLLQSSMHALGLGINYVSYHVHQSSNPYQMKVISLDLLYKLDIGEKNGFEFLFGGSLESHQANDLGNHRNIKELSMIRPMFVMGLNYIFELM